MAYLTYNGKYVTHNGKMVVSSGGSAPGSVSTDYEALAFDGKGSPFDSDTVTITSSGTWLRSLIDTGDGTSWVTALPSSGGDQDTCTITVDVPYEGTGRSCTLRFLVPGDTADVTIQQYGYV